MYIYKRSQKLSLLFKRDKHIEIFYEGSEEEWNKKVDVGSPYENILFNCTKEMYDEIRRV